jgi:putative flippase GtrA
MSFLVATLVNYLLCNHFVFTHKQGRSSQQRVVLTYMVSGVGLLIHHSCLFFAFEWLTLPIIISKVFAMGTAFGWNYLSRKHFVFTAA